MACQLVNPKVPPCFSPPTCLQNHPSQLKYRIKTHRDLTILAYERELNIGESIAVMCSTCEKEISAKELSLNVFHAAYCFAAAWVSYIHNCDEFSFPLLWKAAWSANKWSALLSIESLFIFIASQVMHMKDELEREHERKMTEMREAARRMKEDCSHQVEMERFSDKM